MSQTQTTWPLKKPQQLIYVELGPYNGGMVLGICEQGFTFRSVAPLKLEGPINFAFALDGTNRLQGTAEIAWTEDNGKTGGMKFTDVSPQFRDSLRYWLADEQKDVGREVVPAVAIPLDSMEKIKEVVRKGNVKEAEPPPSPKPDVAKPIEAKAVEEKIAEVTSAETQKIEAKPVEVEPVEAEPVETKPAETKPAELIAPRSEPQSPVNPIPQPVPQASPLLGEPTPLPRMRLYFAPPAPQRAVEISTPEAKSADPERVISAPEIIPSESKATGSAPAPENIPLEKETEIPAAPVQENTPPEKSFSQELPVSALEAAPHETPVESFHPLWLNEQERAAEISARSSQQQLLHQEARTEGAIAEPPRLNRATAAGIISLALAVILSALVLSFRREAGQTMIRLGEMLAGEERKPAASALEVPSGSNGSNASVPTSQGDNSSAEKNEEASSSTVPGNTAATQPENPKPQSDVSTDQSAPANLNPPAAAPQNETKEIQNAAPAENGTGQKEFEQARNILKGNHRQRDLPQAVQLLWTAVRKGNVPAEVTLADLFARGDGVGKSCEQARILLESAIRRGSPEGRRRLETLKRQSCP
jgi:hypothetical protein